MLQSCDIVVSGVLTQGRDLWFTGYDDQLSIMSLVRLDTVETELVFSCSLSPVL